MSSPLLNSQIELRVIQPNECSEVLDFLRVHYYLEEPLTAGSEPKQQDKEDEDFNMSNVNHGTCFMAVLKNDFRSSVEIVGAILAGPKASDEAEHMFEEAKTLGPTKWGRILKFLGFVEREANIFKSFNVQKVLHIHVMAVKGKMRGRSIGKRLLKEVLDLAKLLKYEMVSADCTSFYSARLFECMGFQCVNIKHYKDYVDETGKQIFSPDAPHDCVKTFVLKL